MRGRWYVHANDHQREILKRTDPPPPQVFGIESIIFELASLHTLSTVCSAPIRASYLRMVTKNAWIASFVPGWRKCHKGLQGEKSAPREGIARCSE